MKNRQTSDPADYAWADRLEAARQSARRRGVPVSFAALEQLSNAELPATCRASRGTFARYHANSTDVIAGKVLGIPAQSVDLMIVQWLCSLYGVPVSEISQQFSDDLDTYWSVIAGRDLTHVGMGQARPGRWPWRPRLPPHPRHRSSGSNRGPALSAGAPGPRQPRGRPVVYRRAWV